MIDGSRWRAIPVFLLALPLAMSACTDKPTEGDDSACTAPLTWYADADGDGYGASDAPTEACEAPANTVADATDCDDADSAVHPGADELCGGADENCDGLLDDGAVDAETWYVDRDEDGFGDPEEPLVSCDQLATHVANGDDCDDANAMVYPGSAELCDGVDNDCDPTTLEAGLATFIDEDGVAHDYTSILAGSESAVSTPVFDEPGSLMVCAGTWYTNLEIAADLDIIGVGGPTDVILDGGGQLSVVSVKTDALTVYISDLAIIHGDGDPSLDPSEQGAAYGGAVSCLGVEAPPEITLEGVLLSANEADNGGAIAAFVCDIRLESSQITSNEADYGGGIMVQGGELSLDDTVLDHNHAEYGGAILLLQSEGTCAGSTTGRAGFLANTADGDAGGVLMYQSTLNSTHCDFGEPESESSAGEEDNSPNDVAVGTFYANRYSYGDDTTMVCEDPRCGDLVTGTMPGTNTSNASTNGVLGNLLSVEELTTLEDFDTYVNTSAGPCTIYFYLLSAPDSTSSTWTVVRTRSAYYNTATTGYINSANIGEVLQPGVSYATVVAWNSSACSIGTSTGGSSGTTDLGPATAGEYRWEASSFDRTAYNNGSVSSAVASTGFQFKAYPQRYNFSH